MSLARRGGAAVAAVPCPAFCRAASSAFTAADGYVSPLSARFIELEHRHGAHNYHPLPVVLSRGLGERQAASGDVRSWL